MKRSIGTLTILLVVGLVLAACGPAAGSGGKTLEKTTWKLDSYADAEGQTVDVLADSEITARFEVGQVAGSAGCNRYMGTYLLSDTTLTVEVGGTTMMYCSPESLMEQEMAYLATMNRAASHEIDGDRLVIKDKGGKEHLDLFGTGAETSGGPHLGADVVRQRRKWVDDAARRHRDHRRVQ